MWLSVYACVEVEASVLIGTRSSLLLKHFFAHFGKLCLKKSKIKAGIEIPSSGRARKGFE